jgi:hypothetical protein
LAVEIIPVILIIQYMKYIFGRMKLLLIAVAIVFIGVLFTWGKILGDLNKNPEGNGGEINQTTLSTTPGQPLKASLSVDFGNGKSVYYEDVDLMEGATAYSILITKMNEKGSQVKVKTYDYGVIVESIDNISATDRYFWSYSINGQMGTTAADKYLLQNGDKIEWKFTLIQ